MWFALPIPVRIATRQGEKTIRRNAPATNRSCIRLAPFVEQTVHEQVVSGASCRTIPERGRLANEGCTGRAAAVPVWHRRVFGRHFIGQLKQVLQVVARKDSDRRWHCSRLERPPAVCLTSGIKMSGKSLVPKKGLEPSHPCEYMDLNHARLPIPPLRLTHCWRKRRSTTSALLVSQTRRGLSIETGWSTLSLDTRRLM